MVIHELERDFSEFVKANSNPTNTEKAAFLSGGIALLISYILVATPRSTIIQAVALAAMPLMVVALVLVRLQMERSKWSKRTGKAVTSIDDGISCVEEEQARYVASHPRVDGDVEKIAAGIEYLQALDASVKDSREPWIPPASAAILKFLLTTTCAGSFLFLLQKERFDDAFGITMIGLVVFGLSVVVLTVIGWISTTRSSRRRMLYRALLGARLYMKTKAQAAPWLTQNVVSIDALAKTSDEKPRPQRKTGRKRR
ncbi:hypothetical protein ACN469_12230 [Corallococcus terminator]